MKIKFCFIIPIILLLFSGCSVNYDLNLDENLNLEENVIFSANSQEDIQEIINFDVNVPINYELDDSEIFNNKVSGVDYYDINKYDNNDKLKFNYNYNFEKFNYNRLALTCYEYISAFNFDDTIILSTSNKFLCFDSYSNLDDVVINIKSKYKLIDTNADDISNHVYTWYINKNNYKNKWIYLELDASSVDKTLSDKIADTGIFRYIILILFIVFAFIGYKLFRKFSKRRDAL